MKFSYNLRFPGQYFDAETGFYYKHFRTYDPATGRYIESDPIGLKGGLNTYLYVGANPVMKIDALGLQWSSDDFWDHYDNGGGTVTLSGVGLMDEFLGSSIVQGAQSRVLAGYKNMLHSELKRRCTGCNLMSEYSFDAHQFDESYDVTADPGLRVVGNGEIFNNGKCYGFMDCGTGMWFGTCDLHFYIRDWFKDPWDYFDIIPGEFETGTPYRINADWNVSKSW